jgi:hypothetical protein
MITAAMATYAYDQIDQARRAERRLEIDHIRNTQPSSIRISNCPGRDVS